MNNRHLFLTSGGLTKNMKTSFFNIIGKRPEEVKILYIPTAGIETDGAREGIAICLYAAGNLEDGLNIIPNPIIPHWNGDKLMCLPIDSEEIQLADGQAVYIEGYNIRII